MAKWLSKVVGVVGLGIAAVGAVACGGDDDAATPAVSHAVGARCSADADCQGYAIAACMTSMKPLENSITDPTHPSADALRAFELPFPGGYCSNQLSDACAADVDCGEGGGCFVPFEGVSQEVIDALATQISLPFDIRDFADLGICLVPCEQDSDCRTGEGYQCLVPIDGFMSVINPDYTRKFCVQYVDVSPLLQ